MLTITEPDYVPPQFVEETEDPRAGLTTAQIVDLLAEPGLDRERLSIQVRNFSVRKLLHPAAVLTSDGRRPYLFGPDQALIAAVLGRFVPHSGGEALRAVSIALNGWNPDDIPTGAPRCVCDPTRVATNPALFLIDQAMAGMDGWAVEFASFRDPTHDHETVRARIRYGLAKPNGKRLGTNWHLSPGYGTPLALTILDVAPIVERMFGAHRIPATVN